MAADGTLESLEMGAFLPKEVIDPTLFSIKANHQVYDYRHLRTSSTVRLIEVMHEKVDGCIACKIHIFDIQQQPGIKYTALSYIWGDPGQVRQIFLADGGDDR